MGIFAGKTTKFRIRFSAYAAPFVLEEPWHPDQEITQLEDGGVEVVIPEAHDLEVLPKIMQLGGEAELLAPKAARQRLAGMAAKLVEKHGSND